MNKVTGDCQRYDSFDEDNFTQCGIFFRDVLNEEEKERLVDNIASHISNAQGFLQVSIIDVRIVPQVIISDTVAIVVINIYDHC